MPGFTNAATQAVGADLAAVLPQTNKRWWQQSHLLKLNLMLFSAMLMSSTVGYDNSMMNGLQALTQWQEFMNHPTGAYLGGINAIQAAGSCFGYPAMSYVANRWGRKSSVYIGCVIIACGTILQTASQNPGMFISARFFIGMASGFFGAVPILITEVSFPTHRGKMTSGFNTLYYVGSTVAAWTTFGTRNYSSDWAWRIPSLLQSLIPLVSILSGFIFLPESPRWLIAQGRTEEAKAIFVKWHTGGDENSALVAFEMAEVERALTAETSVKKETSYLDMFRTKGNRHRLFISVSMGIFAQWNGVGIVSYYLSPVLTTIGITSVTNQTLINGFLGIFNLIVAVFAATQVDRLGRRGLLLYSSFGMLICYIIITALSGSFAESGNSAVGTAVIPMLFIYYGFYDIAYTPLVIAYPAEIWPYHLRSKGIAVTLCSTFAALFFNLFVNPIALENIGWRYYIVYVCILVVICIVAWFFYPETRGRSLEEIAVVFDGENAAVPGDGVILGAIEEKNLRDSIKHSEHWEESIDAKV